ncbi:MAG TPA: DUF1569 domain-containing protein [Terriglobales bacterium]|nr:DUF1569 domain-containing protein [Terriglobales bacterium]
MDSHLERLHRALERATGDLTAEQLTRHKEGKWCVAEILEHLALTYSGTVKAMERVLAAGKPLVRPATLKEGIATVLVVEAGHMPGGRQAPEMTRPRGLPPEQAVARIREDFAAMRAALEKCRQRFGASVKIANHPILGPLSVTQWCKFHWVHTRHHIKQVERLRRLGA